MHNNKEYYHTIVHRPVCTSVLTAAIVVQYSIGLCCGTFDDAYFRRAAIPTTIIHTNPTPLQLCHNDIVMDEVLSMIEYVGGDIARRYTSYVCSLLGELIMKATSNNSASIEV